MRHYVVEEIYNTDECEKCEEVTELPTVVTSIINTDGEFPTDDQLLKALNTMEDVNLGRRLVNEYDDELITIKYSWQCDDETMIDYINVYPVHRVVH